jgi:hypothetical protein
VQDLPLFITVDEMVALFRVDRSTLENQRSTDAPPGNLGARIGKHYRYPVAKVQDYLETLGIPRTESARRILELVAD